ncbi:MAG TPA: alpha/beta hydrolase, partial [Xanthobacteraceae bacterium]|nr:alpha/beta hydrolase [Xanthobacteraceae bacterium]
GIVLLDALYSGIDKFANWIADNRSGFFVSSYTPHTRGHNADLEQLLRAKSVPYGAELRHDHLPGSVTFLPAGPISHRDFVNHAWVDSPLKDILVRLDDYDPRVQTATAAAAARPAATAPSRN